MVRFLVGRRIRSRRSAFALALVLMTMALIVVFSSAMVGVWRLNKQLALRDLQIITAAQAARAGVSQVSCNLSQNPFWNAGIVGQPLASAASSFSVVFTGTQGIPQSTNNCTKINIINPMYSSTASVTGYGARTVPSSCVDVISVGMVQGARVSEEAILRVLPSFAYAIACTTVMGTVQLDGNVIDAWNSNNGTYAQTSTASGANILSTNGAGIPFFNVTAPAGGSSADDVEGSGTVAPGDYGIVNAVNGTVTFSAGNYVVGQLLGTGGTLDFDTSAGPIYVYVTQSVNLTDCQVVCSSNIPGQVMLIGTSQCTTVSLGLNDAAPSYTAMAVWAPAAAFTLSSGNTSQLSDFYGAVTAARVDVECSTAFHYDTALQTGPIQVLSRQRLSF